MSKVGTSFTTIPDPEAAAAQLVDGASAGLQGKPNLAILFSTTDYDTGALVSSIQKKLGDVPIWGGSSSTGVFANGHWVTCETGAAALMLIAGRAAGATIARLDGDQVAAGKAATAAAVGQAGGKASALLTLGFMGPEENVLAGAAAVAPGVAVVGGSASDHKAVASFQQFGEGQAQTGTFAVGAVGGEIGNVFTHGYKLTGKKAVVTRCSGRQVIELDGRPAMDVYAEWTGQKKEDLLGGAILVFSVHHPLLLHKEGTTLAVHPVNGNAEGPIDTGVAMSEGAVLELGDATTDQLIAEVGTAARAAVAKVAKPEALILSHCGGRAIALGDRIQEAAIQVDQVVGDLPWVGFLAFGEQGTPGAGRKEHANLSLSVLVLGAS